MKQTTSGEKTSQRRPVSYVTIVSSYLWLNTRILAAFSVLPEEQQRLKMNYYTTNLMVLRARE